MPTKRADIAAEAERLVAQGKLDAAAAKYEVVLRAAPRDLTTLNKLGDIYSRIGKKKQAIDHFLKLCEFYEKDGFVHKAIAIYKKVIKLDPSDMTAARRLADLLASKGHVSEAREHYQIVLRRFEAGGDLESLIACRKAMVALDPQDAEGLRSLAELLSAAQRTDEAAEVWAEAGAGLDRLGEHEKARGFYQRASKLKPGSSNIAARLAASHVAAGDVETGVRLVREALAKGDDADLLALLADIHIQAGEGREAGKALDRAIQLAPQRSELRVRLARLHVSTGEIGGAFSAVEPVLGRLGKNETSSELVAILEEILVKDAKHRGALGELFALKLRAGDVKRAADCGMRLLDIQIESGDLSQAQSLVDRLLVLRPDDAVLKDLRGKIQTAMEGMESSFTAAPGTAIGDAPLEAGGEGASGLDPAAVARLGLPEKVELTREDLDFIAEHMTEADVFVKYGLPDRAVEQLRVVMEKYPTYVPALARLKEIHLEEGQREDARRVMSMLVKAHLVAGDRVPAEEALAELHRYDPTNREAMDLETALNPPAAGMPPAAAADFPLDTQGVDEEFEIVFEEEQEDSAAPPSMAQRTAAMHGAEPLQVGTEPDRAPARSASKPAKGEVPDDSLLDLAAEVDAALGAVVGGGQPAMDAEEPESLEDMLRAFRNNVEQTVAEDDPETRYNLGIAFIEMGLIDEAIGEFQVASRDERFVANCCSMLGLCFRRKGMATQAVRWYRRGLENGVAMEEQQALGLRYDLAEVLMEVGEPKEALSLYTEVFGVDSRFRDVAARIKDLQKAVTS